MNLSESVARIRLRGYLSKTEEHSLIELNVFSGGCGQWYSSAVRKDGRFMERIVIVHMIVIYSSDGEPSRYNRHFQAGEVLVRFTFLHRCSPVESIWSLRSWRCGRTTKSPNSWSCSWSRRSFRSIISKLYASYSILSVGESIDYRIGQWFSQWLQNVSCECLCLQCPRVYFARGRSWGDDLGIQRCRSRCRCWCIIPWRIRRGKIRSLVQSQHFNRGHQMHKNLLSSVVHRGGVRSSIDRVAIL